MINELTKPPEYMIESFDSFSGDLNYLINRVESSSPPTIPSKHSTNSGLLTNMGIDLGTCSHRLYFHHLQNRYTLEQDRLLLTFVGRKGANVSDLSVSEIAYFDGNIADLRQLTVDEYRASVKRILGYYWLFFRVSCGEMASRYLSSHAHTIVLSWLYDNGEKSHRKFSELLDVINTEDSMKIALYLFNEFESTESTYWQTNRQSDILFIVNDRIELLGNVGQGQTNNSVDVQTVSNRLVELGFDPITMGSNPDFSSIERFSTYGGLATNSVEPGDRIHIWLACRNAPSNVLLACDNGGLTILPSNAYICSWLSEMLNASGLRLQKMNQALSIANEFEFSTSIVVESTNLDGMGVEIKLPSSDASQDADSTQTPLYDQDAMKRILESLLADERIHDGCQLKLNDPVLAANGLCELVGERRLDPQDSSNPKFKEDFTDEVDWATASSAPDRLHVWIYPDEISDAVSLSTWAQESEENVPEPPSTTEPVRLAPLDEADQFDYYMDAIRSFHPTVVDPPAGTVELLGIAGWSDGAIIENTRDGYNDTILQIWLDGSTKRVKEFKASTAPGAFSQFYNIKGDAHLVKCSTGTTDGRYKYKVGQHKGYTALNQAEKFKVWRDPDKDGIQKTSSLVETGWFGINLHAAGSGMSLGNWSAGCQVIWGGNTGAEWIEFIGRFDGSSAIHSTPDEVYYTLINSQDMPLPPSTGGGP